MPNFDESVINFAVYEDSVEYVGMAGVTLPNLAAIVQTLSGAGIAGNVEVPVLGHYDVMSPDPQLPHYHRAERAPLRASPPQHRPARGAADRGHRGRRGEGAEHQARPGGRPQDRHRRHGSPRPLPPTAPASTPSATGRPTSTAPRCARSTR